MFQGGRTFEWRRTLGGALIVSASQVDNSLVHLDAGDDSQGVEQLGKGGSLVVLLVEGLVEQDDTTDMVGQLLASTEQQLTVSAPVLLIVLQTDGAKTLADGSCNTVKLSSLLGNTYM